MSAFLIENMFDFMKRGRPKKTESGPKTEEQSTVNEVKKDPLYNCPPCKGEGMVFDQANPGGKICDRCRGTGKV